MIFDQFHFENNQEAKNLVMAHLQQITKSSFQAVQFIEKCGTVLHSPFKDVKDLSPISSMKTFAKEFSLLQHASTYCNR